MHNPVRAAIFVAALAVALGVIANPAAAQQPAQTAFTEWEVPYGGRPRDPYVAPDGRVWFVGQAGNYIGRLDPRSGDFTRFEIDSGTHPHTLIIDPRGQVWYAGNRNAMIGRLDPATGVITRYPMPDPAVRDPHSMVFDQKGNIWFSAQRSHHVGHLDVRTGKITLIPTGAGSGPYGIAINSRGVPWFNLFATNKLGTVDPATMQLSTVDLPHERARGRRIAITSDDVVWYVDYSRGFLGRYDPRTGGAVEEFPMPGGPASLPYGMAADDRDRLWMAESGRSGAVLWGYDPKTKQFFGRTLVGREGNNTIRHMYFDKNSGLLWFGTDQGMIGRAEVSRAQPAM
ncbi:MAG: hypothetical protein WD771_05140 [Gemmatimonadaceae bacterium]